MHTSTLEAPARRRRRNHSPEFRASIIKACQQPGISVAAVALANGINANMLRKWVRDAESQSKGQPTALIMQPPHSSQERPQFIPLTLPATSPTPDIRIEVQRGSTTVSVNWPTSAASECAAWLKEWLA
ncbi:MAG: transposase [Aquabacterium sp.]